MVELSDKVHDLYRRCQEIAVEIFLIGVVLKEHEDKEFWSERSSHFVFKCANQVSEVSQQLDHVTNVLREQEIP